MEIKKETLVVILEEGITDFPLGVVILEMVCGGPRRYLVQTKSGKRVELLEEKLFPVCQGVLQETDFDTSVITSKLPEIIKNLAVIPQKQIEALRSTANGVALGLKRTQERLRELELRPH